MKKDENTKRNKQKRKCVPSIPPQIYIFRFLCAFDVNGKPYRQKLRIFMIKLLSNDCIEPTIDKANNKKKPFHKPTQYTMNMMPSSRK